MSDDESLCWTTAVELSRRIAARDITPMEVADAVLRRIEKVNPLLNAFVFHNPEQVLRDARRLTEDLTKRTTLPPLYGIPYSVKEVCAVAATPVTSGVVAFKDMVADRDEPVSARLRASGACSWERRISRRAGTRPAPTITSTVPRAILGIRE